MKAPWGGHESRLQFDSFQAAGVVIGQADFMSGRGNRGGEPSASTLNMPGLPAISPEGRLFVPDGLNNRVLVYAAVPDADDAAAAFVMGQADFTQSATGRGRAGFAGALSVSIAAGRMVLLEGEGRVLVYDPIPQDGSARPHAVIGQPDLDTRARNCGPHGVNLPEAAVITDGGRIIVADTGNHRVLVWNRVPVHHQAPDLVLGQRDADHCASNDDPDEEEWATRRTLRWPSSVWSDGRRLVVADAGNHRVLIWNTFPASTFQPADLVLGQASFTAIEGNDDDQDGTAGRPSARTFSYPEGVASNGVQLAVADSGNHRILVWSSFPTANFQAADVVLGQVDFSSNQANDSNGDGTEDASPSARVMNAPQGGVFHHDKLIVSDDSNNRVLIFRSR